MKGSAAGSPAGRPPACAGPRAFSPVRGRRTKRSSPGLKRNGWAETERNIPNSEKLVMPKWTRTRTSKGRLRSTEDGEDADWGALIYFPWERESGHISSGFLLYCRKGCSSSEFPNSESASFLRTPPAVPLLKPWRAARPPALQCVRSSSHPPAPRRPHTSARTPKLRTRK